MPVDRIQHSGHLVLDGAEHRVRAWLDELTLDRQAGAHDIEI